VAANTIRVRFITSMISYSARTASAINDSAYAAAADWFVSVILRKGATALETVAPNLNVVTVLTPATT